MKPKLNLIPFYFHQIPEYWFNGPQRRFAKEAGVSEATFGQILRSRTAHPRYEDVCRIVDLLEEKLGKKLDPREVYRGA